jgi:sulfate transport system permease protein
VASSVDIRQPARLPRYGMRFLALGYLFFLLILPVVIVFKRTFEHGLQPVWDSLSSPAATHALQVTLQVAGFAVVCNTIFGIGVAILLVRHRFWGQSALNAIIDLPLAVSPVVVGLALILIYGRFEPVGGWLEDHGIQIIFSLPGMVAATIFVSLPLVARAIIPVLEEVGIEQEQASWTLGAGAFRTFWRITLPNIRWALAYGIVLALARCLGEFGALAVVSGNQEGQTQTLTLRVQEQYQNFDQQGAYASAFLLMAIAIIALFVIKLLRPKENSA